MANGFQGPPAVDFYSMLSGLGDTIQKNAQQRAAQDVTAARGAAMSKFSQLDPNSPDYGRQVQSIAGTLSPSDSDGQFKFIGLAHQAQQDTRQKERDKIEDDWSDTTRNDSLKAAGDQLAIQRAQLAQAANKPFDVSVAGPFGSTSKQTVVRAPDGSLRPFSLNPAAPTAAPSGAPAADASASPPQPSSSGPTISPAASGAPVATGTPSPVGDRPGSASAPQSVGAAAAPLIATSSASPVVPSAAPAPQANLDAVDPATGRREAWLNAQSPMERAYIKKIADYEIDPRTTSTRGGMRENVLSSVAQYDPTYNQNEFGTRAKAMKDFGTGPLGNSVRSFDVGISHLDILQKYITALNSGDMPMINSLRNAYLQQTGSSLPTNVQAVGPIVGAEVSKAIIGSNNALADREELRKPLQGNGSPEQMLNSIHAYKEMMGGQLKGLSKQYEDTTGKKNFNSRLSPSTLSQLMPEGAPPPPKVGEIQQGHRYNGGSPADPNSWSAIQ